MQVSFSPLHRVVPAGPAAGQGQGQGWTQQAPQQADDGSESVSFNNISSWSHKRASGGTVSRSGGGGGGPPSTLTHAAGDIYAYAVGRSVHADLLVVRAGAARPFVAGGGRAGTRAGALGADRTGPPDQVGARCSVALVCSNHWALGLKPGSVGLIGLSVSRFVVFVSKSTASMAAFMVSGLVLV